MQAFGKYFAVVALGLGAISDVYASEEFYATPGSRAMAMGGAFAAFAADSSSIWYNPAGLGFQAQGTTDFTIEYGDVITGKEELVENEPGDVEIYETDSEVKYLGFSTHGAGIAYFKPYNFFSNARTTDGDDYLVETTYQELKFGFGHALNDGFSIGATLDMIIREGTIIDTTCTAFFCADDTDLESTSFGATIGALYKTRLIEKTMTDLQLSAVYRSGTFGEESYSIEEFEVLPARPTSTGFGAALRGPLTFIPSEWAFYGTITAQYDLSEFDEIIYRGSNEALEIEYTRTSFGLELQIISPSNHNFFVRAGMSETESDGDSIMLSGSAYNPYASGIETMSYGVGIILGNENQFVLDYAIEDREILHDDTTRILDQEESLHSLSLSVLF